MDKSQALESLSLANIQVIQDVAWLDERPQCRYLIDCWNAGRDTGERCDGYGRRNGQPSPGYCPINGGVCAMEDLFWVFKPGWAEYAEWRNQGHGYITSEVWPRFRPGMLGCYVVNGDCMAPTWRDADLVVVRIGKAGFQDGAACIISRRVSGFPVRGKYLKRLERIGSNYLITADNPTFEPSLVPAETVNICGVALEGTEPEDVLEQLAVCHVFDGDGRIVPHVRAVARLTEG